MTFNSYGPSSKEVQGDRVGSWSVVCCSFLQQFLLLEREAPFQTEQQLFKVLQQKQQMMLLPHTQFSCEYLFSFMHSVYIQCNFKKCVEVSVMCFILGI